jgi:hypothetical protein
MDTGTGYGRPPATYLRELTEVGPGAPMGERLRRYWDPVGLAADAGAIPRAIRVASSRPSPPVAIPST